MLVRPCLSGVVLFVVGKWLIGSRPARIEGLLAFACVASLRMEARGRRWMCFDLRFSGRSSEMGGLIGGSRPRVLYLSHMVRNFVLDAQQRSRCWLGEARGCM